MSADLHRRIQTARPHLEPEWSDERGSVIYAAVLRRRARRQALKRGVTVTLGLLIAVASGVILGGHWPGVQTEKPATVLRLADGSVAVVEGSKSELEVLEQSTSAVRVRVVRGSSRFDVNYDPERVFEVEAAGVRIQDLGTAFSVGNLGSEVDVVVHSGRVRVVAGARTFELEAGQSTRVAAVATTTPAPSVPAQMPRQEDRAAIVAQLFEQADRSRESGEPRAAAALLERIATEYPDDSRAALAAFTLGRVALKELADPRRAALAFRNARELAPAGPLAEDALAREVEAWSRAGEPGLVQRRAREYLELYPDGLHAADVRRWSSPR